MKNQLIFFTTICIIILSISSCILFKSNKAKIADIDGNIYHSIKIGTQTWMVENLKVTRYRNGDSILDVSKMQINSRLGYYSNYKNDTTLVKTYGRLYNFYATNDPRGLAPSGWHIPTDKEWGILITYLGGEYVAPIKLKEIGKTHWFYNTTSTNESGFTALPGGRRIGAVSADIGKTGFWWYQQEPNPSESGFYYIITSESRLLRDTGNKQYFYSVRCIKDN